MFFMFFVFFVFPVSLVSLRSRDASTHQKAHCANAGTGVFLFVSLVCVQAFACVWVRVWVCVCVCVWVCVCVRFFSVRNVCADEFAQQRECQFPIFQSLAELAMFFSV